MKKLILLAFLVAHTLCAAQVKEVALRASYNPDIEYDISQNSSTKMVVTYSGDEEIMQALEEDGVQNPEVEEEEEKTRMKITTGSLHNGEFPVALSILESANAQLKQFVKSGAVIHGRATPNNFPVFDSISNTKLNKKLQKVFLDAIQMVLSQLKYPDQTIKMGESATIDMPFTLPLGDIIINMNIGTTFKLMDINGNKADFDVEVVFTVTSEVEGYAVLGGGGGSGKMYYDIDKEYYSEFDLAMDMDMSVDMDVAVINLVMEQKSHHKAVVKHLK